MRRLPRALTGAVIGVLALALAAPASAAPVAEPPLVPVVVRERAGAGDGPERLVAAAGGTVVQQLPLVRGFAARVPAPAVAALAAHGFVEAVTPDVAVQLHGRRESAERGRPARAAAYGRPVAAADPGAMDAVADQIDATRAWRRGIDGSGVDVAIIDSGVVPVAGLADPKVVHGPDLSFEAGAANIRHLDTYGHGTHLAGIIAGDDGQGFRGVAPGARLVSLKVADAYGRADVSQVIAAIQWVVEHRATEGRNIRVLNLAFGTDGTQHWQLDPLSHAVEAAWHAGIVVVVSAGNDRLAGRLTNPAVNPWVLAVGASDHRGTMGTGDDGVAEWSSGGDGVRGPDLVAPGRSIVSLRNPGSFVDHHVPTARVGERFFRGSGTSQAAAVVAGAVALVLDAHPELRPDHVKWLLTHHARPLAEGEGGAGLVSVAPAAQPRVAVPAEAIQTWPRSSGTGSLEMARGTHHVVDDAGVPLVGEIDWTGSSWYGTSWSGTSWSGTSWSGTSWSGTSWSGTSWSNTSWSGTSWSGVGWG